MEPRPHWLGEKSVWLNVTGDLERSVFNKSPVLALKAEVPKRAVQGREGLRTLLFLYCLDSLQCPKPRDGPGLRLQPLCSVPAPDWSVTGPLRTHSTKSSWSFQGIPSGHHIVT